ncbi:hypothetical protein DL95DRAFT_440743 [Leptodontidium sp. 2 PMI_412]|nr:hypothetical protein DL95DRAFT_440743 [Leptodontidium sp. 2 PMI_412]
MASTRSPANTPRLRTRNGCWTCRKRRRKCDERKPRCQNCIDKDRKCQYGLQLTFLDVNMQTLLSHDSNNLERNAPGKYQNLQFVDGLEETPDYPETFQPEAERVEDAFTQSIPSQLQNPAANLDEHVSSPSDVSDPPDSDLPFLDDVRRSFEGGVPQPEARMGRHATPRRISKTPRITPSSPMPAIMRIEGTPLSGLHRPPSFETGQSPKSSGVGAMSPLARIQKPNDISSREERENTASTQKLLKMFIDKVIPWTLWTNSTAYQSPRLVNSEIFSQLRTRANEELDLEQNVKERDDSAARELLVIAHLLSEPLHTWRSTMADRLAAMDVLARQCTLLETFKRVSWWALLRFDLGISIISHQLPLTNIEKWTNADTSSSSSPSCGDLQVTYHDKTLLLCLNVVKFRFSQDTSHAEDTWTRLHTQHQSLTASHPSQSQSLLISSIGRISLSAPDTSTSTTTPLSFPFQLHTTRLSFYATLLTHLTSLLLLQCLPPRLKLKLKLTQTALLQSLKTETWHAVQICSLALSNRVIWSYDPVVIAALLLAGRMLSYEAQQQELIRFLRTLRVVTSWVFDAEIAELEEAWEDGYL